MRRCLHGGTLVLHGEVVPHQLSRIDSHYVRGKGFLPEQGHFPCPSEVGQPDSSVIHKSLGRDPFLSTEQRSYPAVVIWCLERGITLSAEHLPGVDNCVADFKSRIMQSSVEWQLCRDIFLSLMREVYQCNVDLFATWLNHQLVQFVSWIPNPFALGTNALQMPWTG